MTEPRLPEPLRALDVGTFAHHSVVHRLPEIARRVLDENFFPPETVTKIKGLIEQIPLEPIRPLLTPGAPDHAAWRGYVSSFEGQTWLQVPWFFAETYFYRRILEATGYFAPGEGWGGDPFQLQKFRGLERIRRLMGEPAKAGDAAGIKSAKEGQLERAFHRALWGNRADLSLWPEGAEQGDVHTADPNTSDRLLANDLEAVLHDLRSEDKASMRVDLILDNVGVELLADLELAAELLDGSVAEIHLHTKQHPTFVSDAMTKDVLQLLAFLDASDLKVCRELAGRIHGWQRTGRLRLATHPFWTSPLSFRDLPSDLWADLRASDLLILKGDANYRRLVGDRRWAFDKPLAEAAGRLPAPLVALRTLKSEVAAGIPAAESARAQLEDPAWMINGRWGLIQVAGLPARPPASGG